MQGLAIVKAVAHNYLMKVPSVQAWARRYHHTGINRNFDRVEAEYAFLVEQAPVLGQRILELGPGQTPDLLLRAKKDGAAGVAAADVNDYSSLDASDWEGILYRCYNGRRLPFADASFDRVWAIDVLEHVRFPEQTVQEVFRVLAPGGRFIFKIDLRDHFYLHDEARWFDCLRHSEGLWRAMTWNRSNHVNRWRYSRWARAFLQHGFVVEREVLHRSAVLAAQTWPWMQKLSEEDRAVYRVDGCLQKP